MDFINMKKMKELKPYYKNNRIFFKMSKFQLHIYLERAIPTYKILQNFKFSIGFEIFSYFVFKGFKHGKF